MCQRCGGSASRTLPYNPPCSMFRACVNGLCMPVPSSCRPVYPEQDYLVVHQHRQLSSWHAALAHANQDTCV